MITAAIFAKAATRRCTFKNPTNNFLSLFPRRNLSTIPIPPNNRVHIPPFPVRLGIVCTAVGICTPLYAVGGAVAIWTRVAPRTALGRILKYSTAVVVGGGIATVTYSYVIPFLRDHADFLRPFAVANAVACGVWYTLADVTLGVENMLANNVTEAVNTTSKVTSTTSNVLGGVHNGINKLLRMIGMPQFAHKIPICGPIIGVLTAVTSPLLWPAAFKVCWSDEMQRFFLGNDALLWPVDVYMYFMIPVGVPVGLVAGSALHMALGRVVGGVPGVPWTHRSLPALLALVTATSAYFYFCQPTMNEVLWVRRMDFQTGEAYSSNPRSNKSTLPTLKQQVNEALAATAGMRQHRSLATAPLVQQQQQLQPLTHGGSQSAQLPQYPHNDLSHMIMDKLHELQLPPSDNPGNAAYNADKAVNYRMLVQAWHDLRSPADVVRNWLQRSSAAVPPADENERPSIMRRMYVKLGMNKREREEAESEALYGAEQKRQRRLYSKALPVPQCYSYYDESAAGAPSVGPDAVPPALSIAVTVDNVNEYAVLMHFVDVLTRYYYLQQQLYDIEHKSSNYYRQLSHADYIRHKKALQETYNQFNYDVHVSTGITNISLFVMELEKALGIQRQLLLQTTAEATGSSSPAAGGPSVVEQAAVLSDRVKQHMMKYISKPPLSKQEASHARSRSLLRDTATYTVDDDILTAAISNTIAIRMADFYLNTRGVTEPQWCNYVIELLLTNLPLLQQQLKWQLRYDIESNDAYVTVDKRSGKLVFKQKFGDAAAASGKKNVAAAAPGGASDALASGAEEEDDEDGSSGSKNGRGGRKRDLISQLWKDHENEARYNEMLETAIDVVAMTSVAAATVAVVAFVGRVVVESMAGKK